MQRGTELEQIEQFLAGQLKGEALAAFVQKMEHDSEFAQKVQVQKDIAQMLGDVSLNTVMDIIDDMEAPYHPTEEPATETEEPTYTLKELLDMFAPLPLFEEAISTAQHRDFLSESALQVSSPPNGTDFDQTFELRLKKRGEDPLKIRMFNNKEEEVLQATLPANQVRFTLDITHLKPGRYYWELTADVRDRRKKRAYGVILRSFFIQKKWMPSNIDR